MLRSKPTGLPRAPSQLIYPSSRTWSQVVPSIVHPHVIPSDWRVAAGSQWTFPSEEQILRRDLYVSGYDIPDETLTGVSTSALAYAASRALSISETPEVVFEGQGGFNTLFRIDFPKDGRKVLARIPLRSFRSASRVESSVATLSFARWVRNIPTPRIFGWNASNDNPVGAPYILQEYMDDVVEPWQVCGDSSDNTVHFRILDELAKWHAAFLEPLPHPLCGVGDLGFAPNLPTTAALSDPNSYVVRPLHLPGSPLISSGSLVNLWEKMWSHQIGLYASGDGSPMDRLGNALDLDDDEECDAASFGITAMQVHDFAKDALRLLEQHPPYGLPCLVNYDYAYRNILLEGHTYQVKAFIDWDDVHVMPFILGVDFPEDIKAFSVEGLSQESNYYRDGEFPSFPPDEYGKIVGAVDDAGKLTDVNEEGQTTGVHERDERIRNTLFREQFVKALGMRDERIAQPDMWKVRSKVLKAHHLLTRGRRMWWDKRKWLGRQRGDLPK